jgi:hypothetical protein
MAERKMRGSSKYLCSAEVGAATDMDAESVFTRTEWLFIGSERLDPRVRGSRDGREAARAAWADMEGDVNSRREKIAIVD